MKILRSAGNIIIVEITAGETIKPGLENLAVFSPYTCFPVQPIARLCW